MLNANLTKYILILVVLIASRIVFRLRLRMRPVTFTLLAATLALLIIGLFWGIFPAAWPGLTLLASALFLNTAVKIANHGYMPCLLPKGMFLKRSDRWVVADEKTRLLPLADIHRFRGGFYSKGDFLVCAGVLLICLAFFRELPPSLLSLMVVSLMVVCGVVVGGFSIARRLLRSWKRTRRGTGLGSRRLRRTAGDADLSESLKVVAEVGARQGLSAQRDDASPLVRKREQKPPWDTITAHAHATKAKDPHPQGHPQRVSRLAAQIAMQMRLPEAEIEEIRQAGSLHDIGMIGIPHNILYKPDRLTPEEVEIIKTHSVKGQKILEPLQLEAMQRIRHMVRHHHESFDGQGYPDKLKGEQIPLGARIIAVAEAFDAMVSDRVYSKARTVEEALAELRRCSGTQFDPRVVTAFLDWLEIHGGPREQQ